MAWRDFPASELGAEFCTMLAGARSVRVLCRALAAAFTSASSSSTSQRKAPPDSRYRLDGPYASAISELNGRPDFSTP